MDAAAANDELLRLEVVRVIEDAVRLDMGLEVVSADSARVIAMYVYGHRLDAERGRKEYSVYLE